MCNSRSRRVVSLLAVVMISISTLTVTAAPSPAEAATLGGGLLKVLSTASQLAGGLRGICLDSSNNIFVTNSTSNKIFELTSASQYATVLTIAGTGQKGNIASGPATSSTLNAPRGLSCRPSGNIIFTTAYQVGKLTKSGSQYNVSVVAGNGSSGPLIDGYDALLSPLSNPGGIAVSASGVIYIADATANEVYSLTPGAYGYTLNIVAGTGSAGSPSPGSSRQSPLNSPSDIALLPSGALVVSDTNNNLVEMLTPDGSGWTTSLIGSVNNPRGLAVDTYGNIAVASLAESMVYMFVPSGGWYQKYTYVGTGLAGRPTAGPALNSNLAQPRFLALDSSGGLYIADTGNGAIEVVNQSSATAPGSPTVSAQPVTISGSITFTWHDNNNGGSDITSYSWSGACSGSGNVTTVTCTGLTGGRQYSLYVAATNAIGSSTPVGVMATAVTSPAAPTNVTVSARAASILVSWDPTTDSGGGADPSYTAIATDALGNATSCTTSQLTCSISGLANGTTYDIQVLALNVVGWSPGAPGGLVSTPTTPGQATSVSATSNHDGQSTVSWSAPTSNGNSVITGYSVQKSSDGGLTWSSDSGLTAGVSIASTGEKQATLWCSRFTTVDAAGNLFGNNTCTNSVTKVTPGGDTSTYALVNCPGSLSMSPTGTLFVADTCDNLVVSVAADGTVAALATITSPGGVAALRNGNVAVGSLADNAIYIVTPSGVSTVATSSSQCPDFVTSDSSGRLSYLSGCDAAIYVVSSDGSTRVLTPSGTPCPTGLGESADGLFYYVGSACYPGLMVFDSSGSLLSVVLGYGGLSQPTVDASQNVFIVRSGDATVWKFQQVGCSLSVDSNTFSATFYGLTNRHSYIFRVIAKNAIGSSDASAPSDTAIPTAPPTPPLDVVASSGHGSIGVSWTPPADDGGATVTSYTATAADADGNSFSCNAGPGISANWTSCNINGLANGTSYTVTVIANNASGSSDLGDGVTVLTYSVPASPTVTAEPISSAGTITFDWSSSTTGGSDVKSYSWSGACSGSGNVTTITCTGLAGGVSFTLYVIATSAVGDSGSGSVSATAKTASASPSAVTVLGGPGIITAWWNAPVNDGGSVVTSYVATATDENGNSFSCTAGPGISANWTSCTIRGLRVGTSYVVTVAALNAWGSSPLSDASTATTNRVPGAPRTLSVTAGSRTAHFSWSAPSDNGGSEVTSYTVSDGHGHQCITTGLACTIFNLTNGSQYAFAVAATSLAGNSANQSFTAVTPVGATISQRINGFAASSTTVTTVMAQQITTLALAIVAAGRWSVTVTGYGNPGMLPAVRLARASHARDVLRRALTRLGHSEVVIAIVAGAPDTTFGIGGPVVVAAATRCVVIATR